MLGLLERLMDKQVNQKQSWSVPDCSERINIKLQANSSAGNLGKRQDLTPLVLLEKQMHNCSGQVNYVQSDTSQYYLGGEISEFCDFSSRQKARLDPIGLRTL